ncbi:MAG TPA: extracellular solute-binding protein [Clostridia bacterium]|nr:extracellular solute-binding protein [Clostridia bacterium]
MKKVFASVLVLALLFTSFAVANATTLKVAYPGNIQAFIEGEDENHNFIIDYIESGLGIDVEWIILPTENALNKLNVMMAAQEVDVVFNGSYQVMLDYYNGGMLAVLNDYAPEGTFAPDVEALTKECTLGEDMFAVFYPGGQSEATAVWMYNKALLADAGIEVPDPLTLDEFTDILYKIKEAYPDKIALTAAGYGTNGFFLQGMQNIYGAFGIANAFRVASDGSLEYAGISQDMRECVDYISKLYADGVLDPEYLVNTKDTIVPKIINDQVVSINAMWYDYTGTYSTYMIDENQVLTGWGQATILQGTRETSGQSNGAKTRQIGAISSGCKNIEDAVRLLAFMSTDDYYYRIMYGEPGVDSVKDENGKYVFLDTPVGKAYSQNGTFFHNFYSVKESKELRCARLEPTYKTHDRFVTDILKFYEPKQVNDPIMVHPYIEAYDDIASDINDLVAKYYSKIVAGDAKIEAFDELIAEFEGLGGTEAVDALNEWYANQ